MNEAERQRRVMEALGEALDLEGAERQRFLDRTCAGGAALRSEVDALLTEETEVEDDFLEVPAAAHLDRTPPTGENVKQLLAPERLGPFRVVRPLGRGRMGSVYLGEQQKPVRRRVALKVIDAIHSRTSRKRFASECQALARLSHPNVASLYEVGTIEDGRSFVAMELIEGTAITTWCDERMLGLEARIELFFGVCAAVRHAHENGILHREIKPSNVLVTEVDGQPVAKVIDFGIARALDDESLIDDSFSTLEHHMVGSPSYMSPEAVISGKKILDARADVYSLGLLFYRLIVGALPFDPENETLASLLRRVVKQDYQTPSIRFAALAKERRREIAARRGLTEDALLRRLRGDLDAIVSKAIARDREQRYGSPADLADDLGGHLTHEPVEAVPPTLQYQVRKFLKRHRLRGGGGGSGGGGPGAGGGEDVVYPGAGAAGRGPGASELRQRPAGGERFPHRGQRE